MDLMSGVVGVYLTTGTIAVNRYAAGWIDPEEVAIHDKGTTKEYELRPPGDLGIVEPYEDGSFRSYEPLTRLDMAVFLTRAFSAITEVAQPVGVFSDVAADAEHAGAVEGILAARVTSGCSTDPLSYCPDQPVPRDQMASFLARAVKTQTG